MLAIPSLDCFIFNKSYSENYRSTVMRRSPTCTPCMNRQAWRSSIALKRIHSSSGYMEYFTTRLILSNMASTSLGLYFSGRLHTLIQLRRISLGWESSSPSSPNSIIIRCTFLDSNRWICCSLTSTSYCWCNCCSTGDCMIVAMALTCGLCRST